MRASGLFGISLTALWPSSCAKSPVQVVRNRIRESNRFMRITPRVSKTLNNRAALNVAGFIGFSAVLFGAFGAHVLRATFDRLGTGEIWRTAVLYHLAHAVVLV